MTVSKRVLLATLILSTATAWGQSSQREPHIGYLFPSGGQRGAVCEIIVGGPEANREQCQGGQGSGVGHRGGDGLLLDAEVQNVPGGGG